MPKFGGDKSYKNRPFQDFGRNRPKLYAEFGLEMTLTWTWHNAGSFNGAAMNGGPFGGPPDLPRGSPFPPANGSKVAFSPMIFTETIFVEPLLPRTLLNDSAVQSRAATIVAYARKNRNRMVDQS